MSYTIIFETRIALLPNAIIHFERRGCNNDDSGRRKDEFRATLFLPDEWEKVIRKWENAEDHGFELKIGSRYCSLPDYGKHLRRMTKRALPLNEMINTHEMYGTVFEGVRYYPEDGDPVVITDDKEISELFYDLLYGRKQGGYSRLTHRIRTAAEIESSLRNKERCEFYIGKSRKSAF